METIKKVLLIDAHLTYPNWSEGKLNDAFYQTAKDFFAEKDFQVLETEIETDYDPAEEVEKHLEADIIILQMPVNWFGAPWIYKKYVDEVFNSGLHSQKFLIGDGRSAEDAARQYGTGGKMPGKRFMICATWNAPAVAFNDPSQILLEGKSVDDLFLNITSNYKFCGVEIVPGCNCFDIFRSSRIQQDLENYPQYLAKVFNLQIGAANHSG